MVTLSEAFRLCSIDDRDSIKFITPGGERAFPECIRTGDQIRKSTDMKAIHVHRIAPWFSLYGKYSGWKFTVDKRPR